MAKGSSMTKKERVGEVIKRLKLEFPNSKCALRYSNILELVIATILSAQCTDERVNMVTADLFQKYKTLEDYLNADLEEFQQDIRSTGFYRNKGKNILGMVKMLDQDFGGEVPETMEELLKLPGVARKTANVVLGVGFGKPAGVVVDTHVSRIAGRLGLTKQTNAVKIEKDLVKVVPEPEWTAFPLLIIDHGRKTCKARTPKCKECGLVDICPASVKFLKNKSK